MKKLKPKVDFLSQPNFDFENDNHMTDIQITLDNYGNLKINDYSRLSEIPYTEILKSKGDVYENNILYMDQFI